MIYIPKVSVIVPNYNHSKYLEQRLESIFNQTFQDFEVILLDDCSTDNSRDIIEHYRNHPKVSQIIYNEINGGTSYKQWYKGIQYAIGELIWIAESDDWCDLRFLECLVPHFEDNQVSLAFCKSINVINNDEIKQTVILTNDFKKHNGNDFISSSMLTGNGIRNGSMAVFRREKFLQLQSQRWCEMKLAGDWLLWIELANNSTVVEIQDSLNFFRVYEGSASNRFTKKGLDLIEGLEVLKHALQIVKNDYSKFKLYTFWTKRYSLYRKYFDKGIAQKVVFEFLKFDFLMFILFGFRLTRNQIREIYHIVFK
jgi:glycosyltransferase involved in cell wall biosynthesis